LKYPKVLKENKRLRRDVQRYEGVVRLDSVQLLAKDTVIVATKRQLLTAKVLGKDAENRYAQKDRLAKSRFWLLVGETTLLILVTVAAVGR
jgi:hypothetical protein